MSDYVWNLVSSATIKQGKLWVNAPALLGEMTERFLQPHVVSYSATISCTGQGAPVIVGTVSLAPLGLGCLSLGCLREGRGKGPGGFRVPQMACTSLT